MLKKLIVIIIFLSFNACFLFQENGIDFEIKNNSNSEITDIKFYTTEKKELIEIEKIEANKKEHNFLSMKDNQVDGSYILEFTRSKGKKEKINEGYYTNGRALDQFVEFEINPDTIIVSFK